jgi:hypothetical protein
VSTAKTNSAAQGIKWNGIEKAALLIACLVLALSIWALAQLSHKSPDTPNKFHFTLGGHKFGLTEYNLITACSVIEFLAGGEIPTGEAQSFTCVHLGVTARIVKYPAAPLVAIFSGSSIAATAVFIYLSRRTRRRDLAANTPTPFSS